jgi:hypothetical protein
MNGLWIAIAFSIWYGISLFISEKYSGSFRFGKQWLFFICFVFSPLAGFLFLKLSARK